MTIKAAPGTRAILERDVAAALIKADPTVAFTFGTFDQLVEATVTQERLIAMLSAFQIEGCLVGDVMGLVGALGDRTPRLPPLTIN